MITLANCENCNNPFEFDDSHAGQQEKCPNCNAAVLLPGPQSSVATIAPMPPQIPPGAKLIHCPDCSNQVSVHAKECPNCGRPLKQIRTTLRKADTSNWGGFLETLGRVTFVVGLISIFFFLILAVILIPLGLCLIRAGSNRKQSLVCGACASPIKSPVPFCPICKAEFDQMYVPPAQKITKPKQSIPVQVAYALLFILGIFGLFAAILFYAAK